MISGIKLYIYFFNSEPCNVFWAISRNIPVQHKLGFVNKMYKRSNLPNHKGHKPRVAMRSY